MVQIGLPNFVLSNWFRTTMIALLVSVLVVFSVVSHFNVTTVFTIIVLMILILIVMNSSRSTNFEDSLPSATYPIPPHLGLDGVSLVNSQF